MKKQNLIESMGSLFEDFGVSPIAGRIFGLLLYSDDAVSLIQISKELSLSKASVSINIRLLERMGYCRKTAAGGGRQHFYILRENYLEIVYKKRLDMERSFINTFSDENSEELPVHVENRISRFMEFNSYIISSQERALKEWKNK